MPDCGLRSLTSVCRHCGSHWLQNEAAAYLYAQQRDRNIRQNTSLDSLIHNVLSVWVWQASSTCNGSVAPRAIVVMLGWVTARAMIDQCHGSECNSALCRKAVMRTRLLCQSESGDLLKRRRSASSIMSKLRLSGPWDCFCSVSNRATTKLRFPMRASRVATKTHDAENDDLTEPSKPGVIFSAICMQRDVREVCETRWKNL